MRCQTDESTTNQKGRSITNLVVVFLILRHGEYQQDVVLHQLINQLSQGRVFLENRRTRRRFIMTAEPKQVLRIRTRISLIGGKVTQIREARSCCHPANKKIVFPLDLRNLADIFLPVLLGIVTKEHSCVSHSQQKISDPEEFLQR